MSGPVIAMWRAGDRVRTVRHANPSHAWLPAANRRWDVEGTVLAVDRDVVLVKHLQDGTQGSYEVKELTPRHDTVEDSSGYFCDEYEKPLEDTRLRDLEARHEAQKGKILVPPERLEEVKAHFRKLEASVRADPRPRHQSARGLDLIWRGDATKLDRPVLSVESYTKWYDLQLLHPDGHVEAIPFYALDEMDDLVGQDGILMEDEDTHVDHVPNPAVMVQLAQLRGWHLDHEAHEMVLGRWHLEVLSRGDQVYAPPPVGARLVDHHGVPWHVLLVVPGVKRPVLIQRGGPPGLLTCCHDRRGLALVDLYDSYTLVPL